MLAGRRLFSTAHASDSQGHRDATIAAPPRGPSAFDVAGRIAALSQFGGRPVLFRGTDPLQQRPSDLDVDLALRRDALDRAAIERSFWPTLVGVVHGLNPALTTAVDSRESGMGQGCRDLGTRSAIGLRRGSGLDVGRGRAGQAAPVPQGPSDELGAVVWRKPEIHRALITHRVCLVSPT